MSTAKQFVICVEAGEHMGALELRKVYEVISDAGAESRNMFRVVDGSGEDYLYPAAWFIKVAIPEGAEELLHELAFK